VLELATAREREWAET